MSRSVIAAAGVLAALAGHVEAETYHVGPNRPIRSLAQVLGKLKAGDVVEFDPGVYREVHKLTADGTADAPITLRGVAGKDRPVFDATDLNVSGKGPAPRAIFQVEGAHWVLERLELRNARNGHNAAGVRLLGSTNAVIRDCKIHRCDMGVFGGDRQTATIEFSEIGFNSTEQWKGYAHNFYMHGNRVVVRGCHIHSCPYGQNFKSRAHYNELWYNWIVDSEQGEVGPVDSRPGQGGATDVPHSNVLMVGNVIISKPNRDGNPSKFILFGSELGGSRDGTLFLFHNTLIAGDGDIVFIQLRDPKARAVVRNNIFVGSNRILETPVPALSVAGSHNWVPQGAQVPDGFTDTLRGADPGFINAARRDVALRADSPCVNRGTPDLEYVDGDGVTRKLAVNACYMPHMKLAPRRTIGAPDLGAYELGAGADPDLLPVVRIGGHTLLVELALDDATRAKGLSGRRSLPPDTGMLFAYPRARPPAQMGFWMKDCLMDLDIAFIAPDGRIVTIHTMKAEPLGRPDRALARYAPTAAAQFALELEAGQFARRGIKVGDRVEFSTAIQRAVRALR